MFTISDIHWILFQVFLDLGFTTKFDKPGQYGILLKIRSDLLFVIYGDFPVANQIMSSWYLLVDILQKVGQFSLNYFLWIHWM